MLMSCYIASQASARRYPSGSLLIVISLLTFVVCNLTPACRGVALLSEAGKAARPP
ncbi:MAG: hypothetical protein QNJ26_09685 [Desulfobacterales bacterium]|nr:hypothetical protein [Desulfobacterales bacterium]